MNNRITLSLAVLVVGASGFAAVLGLQIARLIEQTFFPVNVGWDVDHVTVVGDDLVVAGTLVKSRGCDYRPPPLGFGAAGEPVPVKSLNPIGGANWPPGPERRPVGPWILVGAAAKTVDVYQEHWCHSMWPVMSKLGTVNAGGQVR